MHISGRKMAANVALSLLFSALFASALFGVRAQNLRERQDRLAELARMEARLLANQLEPAIGAAYSLGALVSHSGSDRELGDYAREIMGRWPIIAHLSLAPAGTIRTVYPPEAAAGQIGLDLLNDPVRGSDARRAVEERILTMTGPYRLINGTLGLTARFPVFRTGADGTDRFWGLAVVVVDLERLLAQSGLRELEKQGYRWALSAVPPAVRAGSFGKVAPDLHVPLPFLYMHQVFASSGGALPAFPAIAEVPLPNSSWTLALAPVRGRNPGRELFLILALSAGAGIALSLFVLSFISRTRKLAALAQALSLEVAERKATEEKLRASVAEKELLLREIHHRVKNNLSIVESIISLQAGEARDTRFEEIFNQLSKRIHSITLIHEKLYRGRNLDRIAAQTYLRDLVHFIVDSIGTAVEAPEIEVDELWLTSKAALSVGLILTELCTNAVKYGQGGVAIRLVRRGDDLELSVRNEGTLPAETRSGGGLGLRLVEALSGQLDGAWRAEGGPPVRFVVDFPAASALAPPPSA